MNLLHEGKTAAQWHHDYLLEKAGREQDNRERGLPLAWRRNCNGKLYGMQGITLWPDKKLRCWMYEDGTNKCLHLPLSTVVNTFTPVEGFKKGQP